MTDDRQDRKTPASTDSGSSGSTLGNLRTTLAKRDARGRPLAVYGILGIGVATLLALMLVIYFWSADRDRPEQIICAAISPDRAQHAVRDGQVERLTLAYDGDVDFATERTWGPVLARVDYVDGQCANLPQGIANQTDVLGILGSIAFYNETTESAQVEVLYNPTVGLDSELFTLPTPLPTATTEPTETPEAIETPAATPEAIPTEAPTTPDATPATPQSGTPEVVPTPAATPTPEA